MPRRATVAVDEEASSRLASIMLAAARRQARGGGSSSGEEGAEADRDDGSADEDLGASVRKPVFAGKGAGKAGRAGTRIMAGPQAPVRTVRPEEPSAYPVGALTQELLRDDEIAKIMKHLEQKGFDADADDNDVGPGGGGIRPTRRASKRDEILVGTRRLPGGIGYIAADEGPTPKPTPPARDCFSPDPGEGEDFGSYHPGPSRGFRPGACGIVHARPLPTGAGGHQGSYGAADIVLSPREGGGEGRPMPQVRKNPLQGRRHAAVRLPRHTEQRSRPLRMLASPTNESDDDDDTVGSMADVLVPVRVSNSAWAPPGAGGAPPGPEV